MEREYVKNKDLYFEMCRSKDLGKLTPQVLRMYEKIIAHLLTKYRYRNSDDQKDVLQTARLDFLLYWNNFDPKYPNAFAYVTTIAHNGFRKGFNRLHPRNMKTVSIENFYDL